MNSQTYFLVAVLISLTITPLTSKASADPEDAFLGEWISEFERIDIRKSSNGIEVWKKLSLTEIRKGQAPVSYEKDVLTVKSSGSFDDIVEAGELVMKRFYTFSSQAITGRMVLVSLTKQLADDYAYPSSKTIETLEGEMVILELQSEGKVLRRTDFYLPVEMKSEFPKPNTISIQPQVTEYTRKY